MSSTDEELLATRPLRALPTRSGICLAASARRCRPAWAERSPSTIRLAFDPADVMQVTYLESSLRFTRFERGAGVGSIVRWLERIAETNLLDGCGLTRTIVCERF